MKMKRFVVALLVGFTIFLVGCIEEVPGGGEVTEYAISDFDTVEEDSPAFIVKAFNDENMVSMIKEMGTLMAAYRLMEKTGLRSLQSRDIYQTLESIAQFITSHEEAYQTLQDINTLGQELKARADRYDIKIQLEGAAKTEMLENLTEILGTDISTDEELFIDYRDLSFMIYASELLCMYADNYTDLIALLEEIQGRMGINPIKEDFYNTIMTIDPMTLNLTQEGTWNQLEAIWDQIVAISSPNDTLRLNDILVEDVLTIPEFEVVLDYMNLVMAFVLDVYDFEAIKTDATGHTAYQSLYQMLIEYNGPKEDISIFKTALNQTLSGVDEAVASRRQSKPLLRDIDETIYIKLNDVEITENTKLVTILKALKPNFFKGLIELNVSFSDAIQIPTELDLYDDIEFSVSYSMKILLTELSGLSSSETNIAIDEGFFDVLMDNEIWNMIADPTQIDQTTFDTVLSGISQNIEFLVIGEDGMALTFDAGSSNEMDMSIVFENYTLWRLFQMALAYLTI